jgi:hypothetical protein
MMAIQPPPPPLSPLNFLKAKSSFVVIFFLLTILDITIDAPFFL